MGRVPPDDRPPVPPPVGGPPSRPGVVTAAGVLLIVGGVLGVVAGLVVLGRAGRGGAAGLAATLVLVGLAVSALEIYAGVKVLDLREVGRRIGVAVAVVAAVFSLLTLPRTPVSSVLGIAIDLFIVYALTRNEGLFRP